MEPNQHLLSEGKLQPLRDLISQIGLQNFVSGEVSLDGCDPVLRSPHRLGEAVSYALTLEAVAASALLKFRTGQENDIHLNILDAIHHLHSPHFIWQSGYKISLGAESVPTNGIFKCKDNKYILIISGPPYPKLERGYLNFFDCGNNKNSIQRKILEWDSEQLENELSKLGLPCCIANTREEWLRHPQGKMLALDPVIELEKIASGDKVPFNNDAINGNTIGPLSNIKVLDFTHVLAGPRSTQILAEFGAEVLHISSPYYPDVLAQNLLTNHGKRSAYLDLNKKEDLYKMNNLLVDTDIFANSYRLSVLEKFNLLPHSILNDRKKGIIYLSINTYGHKGPWQYRSGFDHNGQVVSGFAMKEGRSGIPQFSPVFYLTDLLSAYFAAAGMMAALLRRATEGGSYHVKVSLARTAMWVQELGFLENDIFQSAPLNDNYAVKLITENTAYGAFTHLTPPVHFTNMPTIKLIPVVPFGAHDAKWST